MEEQQDVTQITNKTGFSERLFHRNEALRLIGEITGLIEKTDADVRTVESIPGRAGHASDYRVFGGIFKMAYAPLRKRAGTLAQLIVEQLGTLDNPHYEFAFQESPSEFYGENVGKAKEAIRYLAKLSQEIDPTPPIITWR